MKTIVYTSRVADSETDHAALLENIITVAKSNNPARSITGAMLLMNARFLQVLEGPAENVDRLVKTIEADSRHVDFQILFDQPIEQRAFSDWSMVAIDVKQPESFNAETLGSLKKLYDHNFTFRGDLFLELLREILNDPHMIDSMI